MTKRVVLCFLAALPLLTQKDIAGEWDNRFDEDFLERIPGPDIGDYLGIPINAAARLHGDSWDASLLTLPEHQCKPHPFRLRNPRPGTNASLERSGHGHPAVDRLPHAHFLASAGTCHLDGWEAASARLRRAHRRKELGRCPTLLRYQVVLQSGAIWSGDDDSGCGFLGLRGRPHSRVFHAGW